MNEEELDIRKEALNQATRRGFDGDTTEDIVSRAEAFRAFLSGETPHSTWKRTCA